MPFRDDLAALDARREALTRDLFEIQERKRQLDGLHEREKEVERALQDTTAALAATPAVRGVRGRGLPLLDRVRVASPCPASWDAMEGNGRVRFCGECQKNVYNLSAMTRDEAEELVQSREDLCVQLYQRQDGTVITSDCPVGVRIRRAKRRRFALVAIGGGLLASVGATFAAQSTCPQVQTAPADVPTATTPPFVTMGQPVVTQPVLSEPAVSEPGPSHPLQPTPKRGSSWRERVDKRYAHKRVAGGISFRAR